MMGLVRRIWVAGPLIMKMDRRWCVMDEIKSFLRIVSELQPPGPSTLLSRLIGDVDYKVRVSESHRMSRKPGERPPTDCFDNSRL